MLSRIKTYWNVLYTTAITRVHCNLTTILLWVFSQQCPVVVNSSSRAFSGIISPAKRHWYQTILCVLKSASVNTNVPFTPGHMLPDTSCIHLSRLLDSKGYTSRPWHKWIVKLYRRDTVYKCPGRATCIRRHPLTCVRIQVARPGYMFPGDMCPGVNAA